MFQLRRTYKLLVLLQRISRSNAQAFQAMNLSNALERIIDNIHPAPFRSSPINSCTSSLLIDTVESAPAAREHNAFKRCISDTNSFGRIFARLFIGPALSIVPSPNILIRATN